MRSTRVLILEKVKFQHVLDWIERYLIRMNVTQSRCRQKEARTKQENL